MLGITDLAMKAFLESASTLCSIAVFSTHDTAFYRISEETQARLKLPAISFHKSSPTIDNERFNYRDVEEGTVEKIEGTTATVIRSLPVTIPYEINVYAKKIQDLEQIKEDIAFKIFRSPGALSVQYGTGDSQVYQAEIMRINGWDESGSPGFSLGEMWEVGRDRWHGRMNVDVKSLMLQSEEIAAFLSLNVRVFDGLYQGDENKVADYEIALVS